ncbi:MAG: signal peptide peptidase SppA, partial [Cyanobacteria bacterium P01_F01_bin.153]
IVANPGTITGSIGVIIRGNNLEKLPDKVGVSFKVIKSGPYKDILSFDRELTDEERDILQSLIDDSYGQFVGTVASGRNLPEETVRTFADGRIFTGAQAKEMGVVDRLGSEAEAKKWLAELTELDPEKVEVTTIEEKKSLLNRITDSRFNSRLSNSLDTVGFELETNGVPLWMYRP